MKTTLFIAALLFLLSPAGLQSERPDMQYIEGGTFQMGDIFKEGSPFESPVHEVTVSSFYLNKYEVPKEEFAAFVADTGYVTSAEKSAKPAAECRVCPGAKTIEEYEARVASCGAWLLNPPGKDSPGLQWSEGASWRHTHYEQGPRDPVACVSWRDAAHYCNWLSRKEKLPVAYDAKSGELLDAQGRPTTDVTKVKGYRLPTEAEWEFAAREGGKKVRFGNGSDIARASEMNFNPAAGQATYAKKGEFRRKTTPVGSFKPNSLGLYDMSGNLMEWCSDFLCKYRAGPQKNPYMTDGLLAGPRHAARGGAWVGEAAFARATLRMGWVAEDRCNNIGFRLAKSK